MNITINKGGKDYVFVFSTENTGITQDGTDQRPLLMRKWTCAELGTPSDPCEVFFGDYDNTTQNLSAIEKQAQKAIERLPQVVALENSYIEDAQIIEETVTEESNTPNSPENADLPN